MKTIIEVEYKPKVSLSVDKEEIFEGDTVRLSCLAEANPDIIEYRWNIGGEEVKEAQGARELVIEATKDFNDKKITCLARNTVGQSSADYILNVICKYINTPQKDSMKRVVLSDRKGWDTCKQMIFSF